VDVSGCECEELLIGIQTVNLEHLKRLGRDGMADRLAAADFVERALLAMPAQKRPVLMRATRYAGRYAAKMIS